jgi:FtsZ-binding cell division protein ZapB
MSHLTSVIKLQIDQITQLQAEVEALKTELHHSSLAATAEAHEVDRINRELKSLRKDAARYQWLRRMSVGLSLSHQVISQFVTNQGELDAVIAKDTQE